MMKLSGSSFNLNQDFWIPMQTTHMDLANKLVRAKCWLCKLDIVCVHYRTSC